MSANTDLLLGQLTTAKYDLLLPTTIRPYGTGLRVAEPGVLPTVLVPSSGRSAVKCEPSPQCDETVLLWVVSSGLALLEAFSSQHLCRPSSCRAIFMHNSLCPVI